MIKYIIKKDISNAVKIDTDTNDVDILKNKWVIDRTYFIDKTGVCVLDEQSFDVKEGDVIIKFYAIDGRADREYVTISDPRMTDYFNRLAEHEKQECCESDLLKNCIEEA